MPRSRGAKMKSNSGDDAESEVLRKIRMKEDSLRKLLNPMEARIMSFQSVLVWEKPYHSAALLASVNVLFWLATTFRIYHLVGLTGAIVVFVDMWANYIWPEIKVPLSASVDSEDWTPVHPKLMGVPEIAHYLAQAWVYTTETFDSAVQLRKDRPGKFFIFSILGCCALGFFGCCISGIYLLYFTVMGALLLPCAIYHNVGQLAYKTMEPMLTSMEGKMRIKRTKPKKGKHKRGERPQQDIPSIEISDSDEDINEFVPSPDKKAIAALAKAAREKLTVDDDNDDSTGLTPGRLTPQMPSISASRDVSDDESNIESSIGVSEMPSFDALDSSSLSMLEEKLAQCQQEDSDQDTTVVETPDGMEKYIGDESMDTEMGETEHEREVEREHEHVDSERPTAEPIQFVSGHFKQSDEDNEEDSLAQGLDFPDVEDVLAKEAQVEPAYMVQSQILSDAAAKTSQVVSQTVSSIMSGTMSGLSMFTQSVSKATHREGSEERGVADPPNQPQTRDSANINQSKPNTSETDAIDEEFEFLNEDDLDSMDVDDGTGN